ncbi:MAG: DUF1700 domain-containing protein [Thiolinea sp.]
MNNQDYLKALKKALSGMERSSRDEVLQEIQSHITESGADGATLLERFGTPETLAQQYLEGEKLPTPIAKKAGGIGKNILMLIGGAVVLLIALISFMVYWFSPDDFNYADENAAELTAEDRRWVDVPLDANPVFTIDQSRAVFYWHDAEQMRWSCKGEDSPAKDEQGRYEIRHKSCLIYLPKQAVTLSGHQADIILVKPQAGVEVKLHQAQLRMAENGEKYRYTINAERSKVADLQTDTSAAVAITVEAKESEVALYEE